MKRLTRLSVQLAVTLVLATSLSFVVPVFVNSVDYSKAVLNYTKDPNFNNEAVLRAENAKKQRAAVETRAMAAGMLLIMLNTVWFLVAPRSVTSSKRV
jgi:hypothetical protein